MVNKINERGAQNPKAIQQNHPCADGRISPDCYHVWQDRAYPVMHSSLHTYPVWFAMRRANETDTMHTFVMGVNLEVIAGLDAENAILRKLAYGDAPSFTEQNALYYCAHTDRCPPKVDDSTAGPITSSAASFTIDGTWPGDTSLHRAVVMSAWFSAILTLQSGTTPSAKLRLVSDNGDQSLHTVHDESDNATLQDAIHARSQSGNLVDMDIASPVLSAVRQHHHDPSRTYPGFDFRFTLLQQRAFYTRQAVLEWDLHKSGFHFTCYWDSKRTSFDQVKSLIEKFKVAMQTWTTSVRSKHESTDLQLCDDKNPKTQGSTQQDKELDSTIKHADARVECDVGTTTQADLIAKDRNEAEGEQDHAYVPVMTGEDIAAILEFNARDVPTATETIVQAIDRISLENPDALAVESWDRNLTYGELQELSGRVSHWIVSKTAAEPVKMPILTCFSKSAIAVAIMLGVLRSGNHLVPIDPGHPFSRKETVSEQCGCKLMLTTEDDKEPYSHIGNASIQVMDWTTVDSLPHLQHPAIDYSGLDATAVILFTSGSTGKPKGVILKHRALATALSDIDNTLGVRRGSRMLSFSSYAFDVSMWDTWGSVPNPGLQMLLIADSFLVPGVLWLVVQLAFPIMTNAQTISKDSLIKLRSLLDSFLQQL